MINQTSTPLPLPRTEVVKRLIDEAHEDAQVLRPMITGTSEEAKAHNDYMQQLAGTRANFMAKGVCVCRAQEPACKAKAKGWFESDHPCQDHARVWFHFFNCARVQNEDFGVQHQGLR